MFRLIINNWLRNWNRFILLLIGTILIGAGLITLIALSETNKGTIVNALEEKWKASYDIVIRPEKTDSTMEQDDVMDPNYLSGLSGGITQDELNIIKDIEGVAIAAPISMIGYTHISTVMEEWHLKEKGIYRLEVQFSQNDGIRNYTRENISYHAAQINTGVDSIESAQRYNLLTEHQENLELHGDFTILAAAINPQAEAALIGLDQALLENSRYFKESDMIDSHIHEALGAKVTRMPVLLSSASSVDYTYSFNLKKLDVPVDSDSEIQTLLEEIEKSGDGGFLDTIEAEPIASLEFNSDQAHQKLIQNFLQAQTDQYLLLQEKPSPLSYTLTDSPYPDHWPTTLRINTPGKHTYREQAVYRGVSIFDQDMTKLPRIHADHIGVYDPSKLDISLDPATEVPMETYRAPVANYVLDENNKPINPPKEVKATSNPFGYIMQSPTILTTIEAAKEILGDQPIAAIRIKAEGVDSISNDSQQILENIVAEIEQKTRLQADITLGSSPQPLLIHIPKTDSVEELGWIEQPWIKKGAAINILTETKLGFSGLIICLIIVSIIYVMTTNFISYLSRKKEFALLQAFGWQDRKIIRMVFTESIMLSGMTGAVSLIVLLIIKWQQPTTITFAQLILIMMFILFIYIFGSLWPCYLITKITPLQALKQGEIGTKAARIRKTRGLTGMAFNNLFGRWQRNIASLLAIALPCSLLILFMFISLRLNGVLYTSWLGEYVALEVGTPQYIAVGLSLMIAILTAGEMIWQNVQERSNEIALFKAIGWRDKHVQYIILIEGALIGLLSGMIALIIGLCTIFFLYGDLDYTQALFYGSILWITAFVGILSAIVPSWTALKILPVEGMKDH